MTCKPDNKKVFENEVVYSIKCEICTNWCKLQHYRQCPLRIQAHKEQGNDLLATIRESNRVAQSQTGQKLSPVEGVDPLVGSTSKTNKDSKKSKRHRRSK